MRRWLTLFSAMASLMSVALAEDVEESPFDRHYVGAVAAIALPQGGSHHLRRVGGAALRAGYYLSDFWAIEGEGAWLENAAGLSVAGLWHWWGYERLDPFFTVGARGWIGRDCGQVGPKAGIGTFYHLTDSWSLRADVDATLGLDSTAEVDYTISAGVQYSF